MVIGIVGSEEAKFTELGMKSAKDFIEKEIADPSVDGVASGRCHLGGVDIWAEEIAKKLGKPFYPFPPKNLSWEGGYKERNIKIAEKSDKVLCISVDKLPASYTGMKFKYCYHCERNSVLNYPPHIKSGGCWTMYHAIKIGKQGCLFVAYNYTPG